MSANSFKTLNQSEVKKIFLLVAIIATALTQHSFAQDSTKQYQLPQLLTWYCNIKNALVAGNANDATIAATAFLKAANTIDCKIISEGNINTLVKDAGKISETTDIKKQRIYFANFSTNMAAVAKAVKLTDKACLLCLVPHEKSILAKQ